MSGNTSSAEAIVIRGVTAVVSKTAAAPLNHVKNRMQMEITAEGISKYSSPIDCFRKVVDEEGYYALWRGNFWNCIRYFPTQYMQRWSKDNVQKLIQINIYDSFWVKLSKNVLSSGLVGGITLFFFYPIDVAIMTVELDRVLGRNDYNGITDAVKGLVKEEGVGSLWRGFGISVVGISLYRGVHFVLYDNLFPNDGTLVQQFLIGYLISVVAGVTSYPLDTIRKRQMFYGDSFSVVVDSIWQTSGFSGFYQGVGLSIIGGLLGGTLCALMNMLKRALKGGKQEFCRVG